ncbi:MAG TPA: cytochrome P450, partial [Acidimicrobiales bacterium]
VKQGARLFGHDFCSGERVLLLWGSANRDEAQFDAPETLLLQRAPNRHLAFGAGVHRCVGAHLARLEFRVVLQEVLSRLPDYRVVDSSALGLQPGHTSGITRLPIKWNPERRSTSSV